jgi:hypothetical protein
MVAEIKVHTYIGLLQQQSGDKILRVPSTDLNARQNAPLPQAEVDPEFGTGV